MSFTHAGRTYLRARAARSSAAVLVVVVGAASAFVFTSASSGADSTTPLCFGKQATIALEQGHSEGFLEGTKGADVIVAKDFTTPSTINGLGGDDLICVFGGTVLPGQHLYTIKGGPGNDKIAGGPLNDKIFGGEDRDEIHGGGGVDVLHGDPGHDTLFGDDGNDDLNGGVGDDTLISGAGNDNNNGGLGKDNADGGPGLDFCRYNVERMDSCGRKFNAR